MKSIFANVLVILSIGLFPFQTFAVEPGASWLAKERWQIRGRVIGILPDGSGTVSGTNLTTDVSNEVVPEVDFTYFFSKNIAAELVVATAQHEVSAGGLELGDTFILPPTLVFQYHFAPEKQLSPYVGLGINYSLFFETNDSAGFSDLDVDGGFGLALQAGVDYWLNDHWGINFDIKYIELDIDASVTSSGTRLTANNVDLDPVIVGVGFAYRF